MPKSIYSLTSKLKIMNKTSLFKTIYRYSLAIVILIAIIALAKKSILTSLFFIPVLILTLPFLDKMVDEKIPFLSKSVARIGVALLFSVIAFSFIKDIDTTKSNNNTQGNNTQQYATYEKLLSYYQSQTSPALLRERDSFLILMKSNPAYIKLATEKSTDIQFIPILMSIGEICTSINSGTGNVEIPERIVTLCQKIVGGEELMRYFIGLEFRGGVPVEFAEITERFINAHHISGVKDNLIGDANGNSYRVPFDYNLALTNAIFNPDSKTALDELGKSYKSGVFEWKKSKENNGKFRYPQFVFKDNWVAYLKQNYPESKFIPNYDFAMSASELYSIYNANEVSADEKLKSKRIAVSGIVEEIGKDILDEPYVVLSGQGFLSDIQCYVSKEVASNLNKGNEITLIGICDGRALGTNVILKDCELE
ncbi:MAG: hypothetical protein IPK18_03500 [Sphingobacteriales bacterium]|nr:MAG: hypothetical protein IPK18_03500 [Sphingobacteriales bacterium]